MSGDEESSNGEILIVDDEPANLQLLQKILSTEGYRVRTAISGDLALRTSKARAPDLILLDVMMPPGPDGYEVCRLLKEEEPTADTPILFISALDDAVDKVKAFESGGVDYITKPFHAEEVLARVSTHLTLLRQKRELRQHLAEVALDLKSAAVLQRAFLPDPAGEFPGLSVSWCFEPCSEIGGDSLNVLPVTEEKTLFFLFDVAGHGIRAAMLAASIHRQLSARRGPGKLVLDGDGQPRPPAEIARLLNRSFLEWSDRIGLLRFGLYFTMVLGFFDASSRRVDYVQAGHPPPLVVRADGTGEFLEDGDVPMGISDASEYETHFLELAPGESLVLYSDGVTETMAPDEQLYGVERLKSCVLETHSRGVSQVVTELARAVDSWRGNTGQADDITVLGIQAS